MIDLQEFCMIPEEVARFDMSSPWSDEKYTFASNGWVLVRVLRIDSVAENTALNDLLAERFFSIVKPKGSDAYALPELPARKKCKKCNGTGEVEVKQCPECGGEGHVTFENDFNFYDCDCETCCGKGVVKGGKGEKMECPECEGDGFDARHDFTPVEIGNTYFSLGLLHKLSRLDGLKVYPVKYPAPSYFAFSDGDGILMPTQV